MASHHEVTEHKHGSMDISDHQKTFAGFIRLSTWVVGLAIAVLIFLALANS
ncbi:aa3-type cytochrome c oxidase subunit IV [Paracoccus yeei]|uniref:Aa3-type cytochrome c oxidase subunit IV n=2 Tax=Paracoccus TaxID=265 RepID=A0A1V0GR91_9RHOB|nr:MULTISPECIES: aa3-type cytochrome c oxidase subunit IV [Paracoccus]ARC36362.1 aa3-type cytochrome c oxidase subunit IV [Paracoccus yeei]AWX92903.1 aa3-type cytochrome c oxidase subunit IV [Paracoccus mutanolyticus]AYF02349.1 aa3-type cytochrome c oxidase subunit IV [Paracoccus yeei]MBY0137578.1 aa3-type cytochrome c oxidase subunit IV [Paracoccus yeei]QEU10230.1 aa3-type cytochrome c oxidase subunit IV [Paracoccus yeei]